ncbi:MAG: hypothetical protein KF745_12355 [Phycisphaeraceae bacterium]|nr:hypothetical protein [Phycisphaeraceae bacterium]
MSDPIESHLPAPLREALLAEIDPGETLRWCGQPSARRAFWTTAGPAAFFCAVLSAFSVFLFVGSVLSWQQLHGIDPLIQWSRPGDRPTNSAVWWSASLGTFFTLFSLAVALAPWYSARQARRTVYALTTTRVLKLEVKRPQRAILDALEPDHPLQIRRVDIGDGRGDVLLYPGGQRGHARMTLTGITDARQVERLIRATFDPPMQSRPEHPVPGSPR